MARASNKGKSKAQGGDLKVVLTARAVSPGEPGYEELRARQFKAVGGLIRRLALERNSKQSVAVSGPRVSQSHLWRRATHVVGPDRRIQKETCATFGSHKDGPLMSTSLEIGWTTWRPESGFLSAIPRIPIAP